MLFLQVCPFHHGKNYGKGAGRVNHHGRLLCQLWRKVEVEAAAEEANADQEDTTSSAEATSVMLDKVPKENYRIPTPKELQYVYNHYYLDILASQ